MVMVLSLLNSIGTDGSIGNEDSENSVLSSVSQTVTPIFAPMGITQDNWPATVGIFTGIFAKEAVVGTLDSLYTQLGQDEAVAAGVELEAEGFDFFGRIGEAFATIPANLAALGGTLLDPLGLSVGDVSDLETAAEEQAVAYTTFGQMALRFDGRVSVPLPTCCLCSCTSPASPPWVPSTAKPTPAGPLSSASGPPAWPTGAPSCSTR
jgi:ferrous iron transport protein B